MMNEQAIDALLCPERMASAIAELPENMRNEISAFVAGDQKPGSFGDLIKRAVGLIDEGKHLEGGNVVSIVGKRSEE